MSEPRAKLAGKAHLEIRGGRLAKGLDQIDLAASAGTTQSVVSRLEGGRVASATVTVLKGIAQVLDLPYEQLVAPSVQPQLQEDIPTSCLMYCPIAGCPANVPFFVRGQWHSKPTFFRCDTLTGRTCPWCGQELEGTCPRCHQAIPEHLDFRSTCHSCGTPYIPPQPTDEPPFPLPSASCADQALSYMRELRKATATVDLVEASHLQEHTGHDT